MLGARTTTKPRCEKNFADRDDFTCIGPSTYAIQDSIRRLGCFLPDRHCPLPSEGGCLAARSRKQRRNYRLSGTQGGVLNRRSQRPVTSAFRAPCFSP